jgi:hypothetical protein
LSENKTHTITLKGAQNEPWLVLGGASLDELESNLLQSFPDLDPSLELPELIWRAQAMWAAIRAVVVGGLTGASDSVSQAQPYQVTYSGNAQQQPVQDVSGAPAGPVPACAHGPRQWVNPDNKPWKGWFCPLPKDTTLAKCKPQFVN